MLRRNPRRLPVLLQLLVGRRGIGRVPLPEELAARGKRVRPGAQLERFEEPIDHDLLFLNLALDEGLVSVKSALVALAGLGRDPDGAVRESVLDRSVVGPDRLAEIDSIVRSIVRDYERVRAEDPVLRKSPLVRLLRAEIDAGRLDVETTFELIKFLHQGVFDREVRDWFGKRSDLEPKLATAFLDRLYRARRRELRIARETPTPAIAAGTASDLGSGVIVEESPASDGVLESIPPDPRDCTVPLAYDDGPESPLEEIVPSRLPQIPGYELESILGRGGMGVVYRARHLGLDRVVALKVLRLAEGIDPAFVKRFVREAQAAASLQHPHLLNVYDVGCSEDHSYYTMDLVEGSSLARRIDETFPGPKEIARIGALVASALQCAHEAGIVHRDVKPSNILLDERGKPYLSDFGLALDSSHGSVQLTRTGATLGTPPYMPPEQVRGGKGKVDARSDVYSLGASLYEALTGRMPFEGEEAMQILNQVLTRDPVPIARLAPGTPRDLIAIVERSMEKLPRRRYATAREFQEDLERFVRRKPVRARQITPLERWGRVLWRRKALTSAVASTVALLGFGLTLVVGALLERSEFGALLEDGRQRQEAGDLSGALGRFDAALELRPGNGDALGRRSAALEVWKSIRRGEIDRQVDRIRGSLYADPALWEGLTELLDSYRSDLADDSIVEVDRNLRYEAKVRVAREFERGIDERRDGNPLAAAERFEEALRIDPGFGALRLYHCLVLLEEAARVRGTQRLRYAERAARALDRLVDRSIVLPTRTTGS